MDEYVEKQIKNSWYRLLKRHNMNLFQWGAKNHRPSWKRYGDNGIASFEVSAHRRNDNVPVICIDAEEVCNEGKRSSPKRVMLSIYGEAAQELYEMLKVTFEPTVADKLKADNK